MIQDLLEESFFKLAGTKHHGRPGAMLCNTVPALNMIWIFDADYPLLTICQPSNNEETGVLLVWSDVVWYDCSLMVADVS